MENIVKKFKKLTQDLLFIMLLYFIFNKIVTIIKIQNI